MDKKQKLKNHENILPTTELETNQKKKIYIYYMETFSNREVHISSNQTVPLVLYFVCGA